MSKEAFEELFGKFLGESMSPEEIARFRDMFNDEQNRSMRDRILESAFSNKAFVENGDYDAEEIFRHLTQQLQPDQADQANQANQAEMNPDKLAPVIEMTERRGKTPFMTRARTVAAAVLLLILAGAGWMILGNRHSPRPMAAETGKPATLPGNRAILTLGNGQTIPLDDTSNGLLSKQGESQVIKMENGLLAYHAAPEEAGTIVYNTITTPRGGQYQVILPDGTHAWLNSASSLKFPSSFAGRSRRVVLTGEGYFEVARHPAMPFIVAAGKIEVDVLGTHFNIMAYPGEGAIKTTLEEGAVKVVHGSEGVLISPGQQAQLSDAGTLKVIKDADLEAALAWKNGKFQFNETDIETIMRQISRWYDVDITYRGNLSGVRLSGSIARKESVGQLLELLQETQRVRFITEGKQITVMPY